MLAEKVQGKNELTEAELSAWGKIKNFFVEILVDIPKNEKARDAYIARIIRAVWDRAYQMEEDENFFDFKGEEELELAEQERVANDQATQENSPQRKEKAKKDFRAKLQKRKIKKLSAEEQEVEKRRSEVQEFLDGIPDEEVSDKLEAISTIEEVDLLSDDVLQYAAENGEVWADKELTKRIQEREATDAKNEGESLLSVMSSESMKLPTPKAIISHAKENGLSLSGTLFGEINDLYNSLNFYQRQKYFTKNYVDIDDLASRLSAEHGFQYDGSADFLSDFAENIWGRSETRFSFANNEELFLSPDFEKQIAEVRAKYENTPMWLKAPNGQPTKLTEEQWLAVRTPNFKRWFGDWETLAEYNFLNGEAIASISIKDVPQGGFAAIREWATNIFKKQGGIAKNQILGDVILDKASVNDSLAHGGANLFKSAAFEVAKDVIEKGVLIFNNVNKGRDSYYFAAPVDIDGRPNIVVALVHKFENSNRFYLHSVGTKESLLKNRVSGLSKDKSSNTSTTSSEDYISVLQKIFSVNEKDVSKVIDENGEPLVVYHGSDNTFFVFDRTKSRANADIQGNFFSPWEEDAQGYGANVRAFFLNIKNPANESSGYGALKKFSGQNQSGILAREELIAQGYDGVNNEDAEFIAFNSNQIKSATDNIGTYSENPDIRFSMGELNEELKMKNEELNNLHSDLYEQYQNGDNGAYEKAVQLVAEEARRKGYDVKVYHGTGADGFNIADATSKHEENGEGNQAHGKGLYMAVSRDTAEGYSTTEDLAIDPGAVSRDWDSIYIDESTTNLLVEYGNAALKISSDAQKLADMKFSYAQTSSEHIKKLKNAETVVIGKDDYKGLYELNAKSAFNYVMNNLRGKKFTIADTDEIVEVSQLGAKKITSHDRYNEDYLRSFVKIPEMIENSIFLGEEQNQKHNDKYEKYRYYACGLNIGGVDYTARLTIGQRDGNWYYDQALTQIEKGDLIDLVRKQTSLSSPQGSPDGYIDNRLISLLQDNNNGKVNFSFADNNLHQKKREQAVLLAKKMYERMGDNYDVSNPNLRNDIMPTQDERDEVYMSDNPLFYKNGASIDFRAQND